MADRDDLDYFMEHAILPKDLRDLADRARAIRARERRLAVLAHEMAAILKHDGMDGDTAMAWLRRYEEAVKDRARAEIGE